jgi:hypothetical protein
MLSSEIIFLSYGYFLNCRGLSPILCQFFVGSLGHPGGILCGILCGIRMTCDGPHVTRDTRVGLIAGGCPCGWLGSWSRCLVLRLVAGGCPCGWLSSWAPCLVLSLACPSTHSRDEATVLTCWFIDFRASWSMLSSMSSS